MKTRYSTKLYHAVLSNGRLALFRNDKKYDDLEGCKIVFKNEEKKSIQVISKSNHDNKFHLMVKDDTENFQKFEVCMTIF